VVIAPDVAEVVRCAGGWMFDQVMAGWDVTVVTADRTDARPLRILGTRLVDLEGALARPVDGPCLQATAVQAELYDSDPRVRRFVLEVLDKDQGEVRVWGDAWPDDLDGGTCSVTHRLSLAARAFKAQALAAVAVPADPGEVAEVFRKGAIRRPSPVLGR
jgi:hypothetical protein